MASSFDIAFLASPLAIVVVGWFSIRIANKAIETNQAIARKKASLDLMISVETGEAFEQARATFVEVYRTRSFERVCSPKSDHDRACRVKVHAYLNHYEAVSLGIEARILDEGMYKSWMKTVFVRDFVRAAEFIDRERRNGGEDYNSRLFEKFQYYAERWAPEINEMVPKLTSDWRRNVSAQKNTSPDDDSVR